MYDYMYVHIHMILCMATICMAIYICTFILYSYDPDVHNYVHNGYFYSKTCVIWTLWELPIV